MDRQLNLARFEFGDQKGELVAPGPPLWKIDITVSLGLLSEPGTIRLLVKTSVS